MSKYNERSIPLTFNVMQTIRHSSELSPTLGAGCIGLTLPYNNLHKIQRPYETMQRDLHLHITRKSN